LAEAVNHGGVLELGLDEGGDAAGVEPEVERAAQRRVVRRQEQGGAVEGLGERAAELGGSGRRGEERHAALAEEVVEAAEVHAGADRGVAEDHVEAAGGEVHEEAVDLVLAADQSDGLADAHGRLEEQAGDGLGDGVGDADGEAEGWRSIVSINCRPRSKISPA
jgi:hypothetical protein